METRSPTSFENVVNALVTICLLKTLTFSGDRLLAAAEAGTPLFLTSPEGDGEPFQRRDVRLMDHPTGRPGMRPQIPSQLASSICER